MSMPTFDEILTENGYHCEYYGKWHVSTYSAEIYKNPQLTANNGNSIFGPGGQSYMHRDYLATVGSAPAPGEGEFVDGMSKWPYTVNPLDRYYGMTWESLQSQGIKHSQQDKRAARRTAVGCRAFNDRLPG